LRRLESLRHLERQLEWSRLSSLQDVGVAGVLEEKNKSKGGLERWEKRDKRKGRLESLPHSFTEGGCRIGSRMGLFFF